MIKLGVQKPEQQRDWIKADSDFNTGIIIVKGLQRRGFTLIESCAIAGNLWVESLFSPTKVNSNSGAYGIAQWVGRDPIEGNHRGRYKEFIKYVGEDKSKESLTTQLDFLRKEMTDKSFSKDGYEVTKFNRAMSNYGDSVEGKAKGFAEEVERPTDEDLKTSMPRRQGAALELYSYFTKK